MDEAVNETYQGLKYWHDSDDVCLVSLNLSRARPFFCEIPGESMSEKKNTVDYYRHICVLNNKARGEDFTINRSRHSSRPSPSQ